MLTAGERRSGMHTAVFPQTTDALVELVVPYLSEGLQGGAAAVVNLAAPRLVAVRDALGPAGAAIDWSDTAAWHPSPAQRLRALPGLVERARHAPNRPLRLVSEPGLAATCSDELRTEWLRVDAVVGSLLEDAPVELVCVYDASALPPPLLAHARRLHPHLGLCPALPSEAFVPAAALVAALAPARLAVPPDADHAEGAPLGPPGARRFLREVLPRWGLAPLRVDELVLVATELVTNSCKAGAAWVALSCWQTPHGLALQVDDDGCGMAVPHAGFHLPPPDATGGRGVWIVRQLTDVVEIAPRAQGTSVRVHAGRGGAGFCSEPS